MSRPIWQRPIAFPCARRAGPQVRTGRRCARGWGAAPSRVRSAFVVKLPPDPASVLEPCTDATVRHAWDLTRTSSYVETYKAAHGVSIVQIRDWLGHSSIATTQIYLHTSRSAEAKKLMEGTSL